MLEVRGKKSEGEAGGCDGGFVLAAAGGGAGGVGVREHYAAAGRAKAPTCQYCGSASKCVDSAVIYNGRSFGWVWTCARYPACDAYVGCHPGTKKPLGILADKTLRAAKNAAHEAFDALWRAKMTREGCSKREARTKGYLWLSAALNLPPEKCHIGMFTEDLCRAVVAACSPYRKAVPA